MDAALWSRLKAEIDNDFYRMILDAAGCGPFDGGCVVFARALQKVVGGEIFVLTRTDGRADHAAVLRNGVLIDYDGPLPVLAGDGAVALPWCGMWLCIEPDGYTHS